MKPVVRMSTLLNLLGKAAFAIMMSANAGLAENENTTIILHAMPSEAPYACDRDPPPFECGPLGGPEVTVESGDLVNIFVFLRNYDAVSTVVCRFAIDGGSGSSTWRDWVHFAFSFGCQPGQIQEYGPDPGDVLTAFSCITSGALQPLGLIFMVVGTSGCLGIEEHTGLQTSVWRCGDLEVTQIPPRNRGRVCVGPGGYDACDPQPVPVENETWGRIKRQYGGR